MIFRYLECLRCFPLDQGDTQHYVAKLYFNSTIIASKMPEEEYKLCDLRIGSFDLRKVLHVGSVSKIYNLSVCVMI